MGRSKWRLITLLFQTHLKFYKKTLVIFLQLKTVETLDLALSELPEEQRDVFVKHEFEQKSFKELAEINGETVNTLISRKRYAVLHLRKRLSNLYAELEMI